MSKVESGMRAVIAFNEAFNRHDVDRMMNLMADDCIFENTYPAPDGTRYSGTDAVTEFWKAFFEGSPNAHIDIEDIFGAGNHCVMRWRYTWGDGHVRGVDIFKVEEGLIHEKLSYVKG